MIAAPCRLVVAKIIVEPRARRANEAALQNPALNELRKQLAEAESEYSRALVQFEPEYPAAKALREKAKIQ